CRRARRAARARVALDLPARPRGRGRGASAPQGRRAPCVPVRFYEAPARGASGDPGLHGRADGPRGPWSAGRPLHGRRSRGVVRQPVRGAPAVGPDGLAPARSTDRARARPRHRLRRDRARLHPGSRRWAADRAPGRPTIHGGLYQSGHHLFLRHLARRPGETGPGASIPPDRRGRGAPALPRGRDRAGGSCERGDRMSVDKELNEYTAKSGRSRALHEEALAVMPGGNSRSTTFFDPYPFAIQRGQGAHVWDADGIDRLHFNVNYTSLILGHAPPDLVKVVQQAVELGLSFPGPTEHEVRLAELLTRRVPAVQAVRFTNSGTEATMNAVRLARALTGRTKSAKFEGAYHGTHDWVMVSVSGDAKSTGSRKRPKPVAWSAGVPPAVLKHVVVLPWNDVEAGR